MADSKTRESRYKTKTDLEPSYCKLLPHTHELYVPWNMDIKGNPS